MKMTKIVATSILGVVLVGIGIVVFTSFNNKETKTTSFYSSSSSVSKSKSSGSSSSSVSSTESSSQTEETAQNVTEASQEVTDVTQVNQDNQVVAEASQAAVQTNQVASADNQAQASQAEEPTTPSTSILAGTWTNDLGQTITVSVDGQIVSYGAGSDYNLAITLNASGYSIGSVYPTNGAVGGAGFIYIPAGVANPHIGTVLSSDTIIIGQSVDADEHPFYRN